MNKYMYIIPSVEIIEIKASGVLMASDNSTLPSDKDATVGAGDKEAPRRRVF